MTGAFRFLSERVFIHFRRGRMRRFYAMVRPGPRARVLDIGGAPQTWLTESVNAAKFPVTLVNIHRYAVPSDGRLTMLEGDATALPFGNGAFEIAFSNSVIEHVGGWEAQQAFAREARRVARTLWVQTPARSFPLEAHLLAPYIQYLPRPWQHRLARWTPRGWMTPGEVHHIIDSTRLLTYREMRKLFPDCRIERERFLGLTKSYIAVRLETGAQR